MTFISVFLCIVFVFCSLCLFLCLFVCLDGGGSDDTTVHSRDTFSQVHTGNTDCSCMLLDDDSTPFQNKSASIDCDDLMRKAYGTTLIQSSTCSKTPWYQRWESVVHHSGNHYVIPGGPTGRRYVDLLHLSPTRNKPDTKELENKPGFTHMGHS